MTDQDRFPALGAHLLLLLVLNFGQRSPKYRHEARVLSVDSLKPAKAS